LFGHEARGKTEAVATGRMYNTADTARTRMMRRKTLRKWEWRLGDFNVDEE